jgi:hypothetical protein
MLGERKWKRTNIIEALEDGTKVCRIEATRDIRKDVKKGDLGGWINVTDNDYCVPHNDDSWIYPDVYFLNSAMYNSVIRCSGIYRNCILKSSNIEGNGYFNCETNNVTMEITECTFFDLNGTITIKDDPIQKNSIFRLQGIVLKYPIIKFFGNIYVLAGARFEISGDVTIGVTQSSTYGYDKYNNREVIIMNNVKLSNRGTLNAGAYSNVEIDRPLLLITGSKYPIEERGNGMVTIGCNTYHINEWMVNYEKLAKEDGWLNDSINEYYEYLKFIQMINMKNTGA